MTELRKLAEEFSEEAEDSGHDMSPLDVLDILASCGLTLRRDASPDIVRDTYFAALVEDGRRDD